MLIKPLKKFGQNYLKDKNIVIKMIECLNLIENDSVLEIGPGKGFITNELITKVKSLIAVEIDTRVIDELKLLYPSAEIINTDFTKINFNELKTAFPLKIIGNIPFNLTGNILFKLLENKSSINEACLIIPYDIAKRLTAKTRTKEYGSLTVIFKYFATITLVTKVSQNVFFPKPNIDASIIHIKFDKSELPFINNETFIKVVKAAFGNRRKTLNNSLRNSIFAQCNFSAINIDLTKRAEELELNDFIILTEFIQKDNASRK